MTNILLEGKYRRVHFVGVGGTGMAPLARILHDAGCEVTGSDLSESPATRDLRAAGVTVFVGHRAEHVGNAELVVASSAVRDDNPEVMRARERELPVLKRAEVLGALTRQRKTIAVAGTHGKTTTTAMVALILARAGLDPTYMVGGDVADLGGSGRLGSGEWLVAEADEFDRSFLRFAPRVAVVTNIEADHLDYYGSLDAIEEAFRSFAALLPADGALIGCADDERVRDLLSRTTARTVTYGLAQPAAWWASDVWFDEAGSRFVVHHEGETLGEFSLRVPGRHNVANALAAIAAVWEAGVTADAAREALAAFGGARRRFEVKGVVHGVTVVDDYGHHPTEIAATLAAARTKSPRRLWCVFQPHTYHRIKSLKDKFSRALEAADVVVVTEVYKPAGREETTFGVGSADIVAGMNHPDVRLVGGLDEALAYVCERLAPGDMLVTMGAGDIFRLGEEVLTRLGQD